MFLTKVRNFNGIIKVNSILFANSISKNINYTTTVFHQKIVSIIEYLSVLIIPVRYSNDLLNLTNDFPLYNSHEFSNQVKWNHNNSI